MKYYRITYQPTGRHHKEWTVWEGENREQVRVQFRGCDVFKSEEISKEEFDDNFEGY